MESCATNMDELVLIIPDWFIEIERFFLDLSIVWNQAFVVHAFNATFVTKIRSEVEHVPHEGAPQILLFNYFIELLVKDQLVLFRIIVRNKLIAVIFQYGFSAVFSERQRFIPFHFLNGINHMTIEFNSANIPASVEVESDDIWHLVQWTCWRCCNEHCSVRLSAFIKAFCSFVELAN